MVSLLHLLPNVKMHRRYRSLPPSPHQDHQDSNNFDDQKTYIHMVRKVSYGRVWKDVVRFPDPLRKWVGGTNPSRAGNFTLKASSSENVVATPPHDTHRWILQHVDNAWELSKLGKVNSGRS